MNESRVIKGNAFPVACIFRFSTGPRPSPGISLKSNGEFEVPAFKTFIVQFILVLSSETSDFIMILALYVSP